MKKHTSFTYLLFIVLFSTIELFAQEKNSNVYVRGDAKIEYRWRSYSSDDEFTKQEANRGIEKWNEGYTWERGYKSWDNEQLFGTSLLFRGGSPYARAVRCVSDIVPADRAGKPVTFAIPLNFSIGSEELLSVALKISGQREEVISLNLKPQREISVTTGTTKVSFYTLKAGVVSGNNLSTTAPSANNVSISATGMLHIRVYPSLLNYGGRMTFEFYSNTKHMDIESALGIGSIWKDMSNTNIKAAWEKSGLTEEKLDTYYKLHVQSLIEWNSKAQAISENLSKQAKVEVSCSEIGKAYDRGERRVMAYSGTPIKDYQNDSTTQQMSEMAKSVTTQMGKKFSLFRYQHQGFLWDINHPDQLNKTEKAYFDLWIKAAKESSEEVMLDIQFWGYFDAYKKFSKIGTQALPAEGVPGYTWDKLRTGYITALRYAKKTCPQFKIFEMVYEFDNISNTEVHRDAHYQLYKTMYQAVNEVNKDLAPADQIKIAGLGVNTPDGRMDFIDGFLKRFKADADPQKHLDYLTWHTYLFPAANPNTPKGYKDKLNSLLEKNQLPLNLPVIVNELGLAEPSTIEDLSDLIGASRKEAAMACFSASIHDWYLRENGNFIPISGAGWHFTLLTYGKQNVLSPYAKGMVLRSRLGDATIPSVATPQDDKGYGLYSFATKEDKKLSVLVWSASPAIFYSHAKALHYPKTEVVFNDLPADFQKGKLKVTIQSSAPDQEDILRILSQDKCQTLPITRGADRYYIDFTPEEVKVLNAIPTVTQTLTSTGKTLTVPLDVHEYGMYLITVEKGK